MTKQTLTPVNGLSKQKKGEVLRLQQFMEAKNLKPVDLYKETGISRRTIEHVIYDDKTIGGKLLRGLNLFYGVSIDWLVTGEGSMFMQKTGVAEPETPYEPTNSTFYFISFISDWAKHATPGELSWFETEARLKIKQVSELRESTPGASSDH